jgi:hypothetical protein
VKDVIKVTRLDENNVNEYSLRVSEIYRDGYFFNPKKGRGFYPHDFVYHPKEIINSTKNHSKSVFWDYIEKNNTPLSSLMGYLEGNELEIKALVNTISARKEKKNYTLSMGDYLSNAVLEFLNNPKIYRVIAEPIIFSPQVLSHTAATDAFPIGYAPNHILIQTPKFKFKEFKGDLDACMFDRNHYYRKDEITCEDNRPLRKDNCSLAEVFPLAERVSSFAGISPPKVKMPQEYKEIKSHVQILKAEPVDALFYQTKQAFRTQENEWAYALKNINDNSSYLDFSNCTKDSFFKSLLESILKSNKNTRMLQTKMPQNAENLYRQKILIEKGFKPIIFIPGGAGNGIDSITYSRHKRINFIDKIISSKILKYHDEYLYKSYEKGYLEEFKGYDDKLYLKNINRHIEVRNLVLSNFFQ